MFSLIGGPFLLSAHAIYSSRKMTRRGVIVTRSLLLAAGQVWRPAHGRTCCIAGPITRRFERLDDQYEGQVFTAVMLPAGPTELGACNLWHLFRRDASNAALLVGTQRRSSSPPPPGSDRPGREHVILHGSLRRQCDYFITVCWVKGVIYGGPDFTRLVGIEAQKSTWRFMPSTACRNWDARSMSASSELKRGLQSLPTHL
jgi:hypothetical protein